MKVVRIDKGAFEYAKRLSMLNAQIRAIGVNYNQVTKAIHINFNERRAAALLARLESYTQELQALDGQVIRLTKEFETKCLAE